MRNTRQTPDRERAETLAIQALAFLAEDAARIERFLALAGIGPADIRQAAAEAGFLRGVLEHVTADEALLIAFAEQAGIDPNEIVRAQVALGGGRWERDMA